MSDASNRQTILSVITGLISVVTPICIGFFLTPFIVKSLGEEANGFAQLANNFVMYAGLLTTAFNSMGGRFLSVSYHNGEFDRARHYYSSLVLANIVIALLLMLPAYFIVRHVDTVLSIETADVSDVKILFGCVFLNFFAGQFISLFSMSMFVRNKLYIQNILNLIRNVLNALLLLCAFSFLPARIYYVSAVSLLLSVALLPCYFALHRRILSGLVFRPSDFSFSSIWEMLKSGIWNTVSHGGNIFMTGMDLLLADLFIDPVSMGVLSVSKTVPTFIVNLTNTLNANLSPSITIAWAQGGRDRVLKELRKSMKISSILIATPIMLFCGFGVEFYQLWVPTLDPKELTWLSFLACMHLAPMAGPLVLNMLFSAANKLRVNSLSYLVFGVINVAIVYGILSFDSHYGIFAIAGVSAILGLLRYLLIFLPYAAKILGLKWHEFYKDVGTSILCCGIVLLVVVLIKQFVGVSGWISLAVAVLFSAVISFVAEVFLLCNKEERLRVLQFIEERVKL